MAAIRRIFRIFCPRLSYRAHSPRASHAAHPRASRRDSRPENRTPGTICSTAPKTVRSTASRAIAVSPAVSFRRPSTKNAPCWPAPPVFLSAPPVSSLSARFPDMRSAAFCAVRLSLRNAQISAWVCYSPAASLSSSQRAYSSSKAARSSSCCFARSVSFS